MAGLILRGKTFYALYRVGISERRISLQTSSRQVAKEKLRKLESGLACGGDNPLPTKTPIAEVLDAYVKHIRVHKTPKSAQTEIYYLREAFGDISEELKNTSRRICENKRKKPLIGSIDRRRKLPLIEVRFFEDITTAAVSSFIAGLVEARSLAPKTANHYRQILTRLFNWSMKERGIRIPGDRNPASAVKRYREEAPNIHFLTLEQIDAQLKALTFWPQMKTMVAVYIYAGLRREEALWLQKDDIDLKTGTYGMIRIHAKEIAGRFWQPKTRQNRVVPISRTLRSYLDKWKPPKTEGNWYFPSPEGKWYDPDNFSQGLRDVQKKAGLDFACLDFRHTFGSQLAMKGESLYKISTLMGNSPEICRRHYAALVPEDMTDTVEFPELPQIIQTPPTRKEAQMKQIIEA